MLVPALAKEQGVLPQTHPLMLFARGTLARTYAEDSNKLDQAKALFRQMLAERQLVLGTNHPMTVNVEIVLAAIHLRLGEFSEAEDTHRRLLPLVADGHLLETGLAMRSLCNLIQYYRVYKQWPKAEELALTVLAAARQQSIGETLNVVNLRDEWARCLMAQERYAEAEAQLQVVIDVRKKHPSHGRLFSAMSRLGYCLFKQQKPPEQEQDWLNRGYRGLEQQIPRMPEKLRLEIVGSALKRLIEFYDFHDARGQAARADAFRNKLDELEKKEGRRLLTTDYIVPL